MTHYELLIGEYGEAAGGKSKPKTKERDMKPTVDWNSESMWGLFSEEVASIAVARGGSVKLFRANNHPHILCDVWVWVGPSFSEVPLRFRNMPTTAEWRDSLIYRPRPWQVPDKTTLNGANVWARNGRDEYWRCCHSAGPGRCYGDGGSPWTTVDKVPWKQIVLSDLLDPNRKPPLDWTPEVEVDSEAKGASQ